MFPATGVTQPSVQVHSPLLGTVMPIVPVNAANAMTAHPHQMVPVTQSAMGVTQSAMGVTQPSVQAVQTPVQTTVKITVPSQTANAMCNENLESIGGIGPVGAQILQQCGINKDQLMWMFISECKMDNGLLGAALKPLDPTYNFKYNMIGNSLRADISNCQQLGTWEIRYELTITVCWQPPMLPCYN